MSALLALPVSGDAFLYEQSGLTVLVDGGRSSAKLANLLKQLRPNLSHIDVVICTHADQDHAGGLANFLGHGKGDPNAWNGTVGEFWLPGRWQQAAKLTLTDPKNFIQAFIDDIDRLSRRELSDLEQESDGNNFDEAFIELVAQRLSVDLSGGEERAITQQNEESRPDIDAEMLGRLEIAGQPVIERKFPTETRFPIVAPDREVARTVYGDEPTPFTDVELEQDTVGDAWVPASKTVFQPLWLKQLRAEMETRLDKGKLPKREFTLGRRRLHYRMGQQHLRSRGKPGELIALGPRAGKYFLELIEAVEAIRDVAETAIARRIPIRWFDYEEFEQSGIRRGGYYPLLLPMNSAEQVQAIPELPSVLYLAALSVANRESLVFYAAGDRNRFGVLFSADSRLGYKRGGKVSFPPYSQMRRTLTFATAPHHGSETNRIAYSHAQKYGVCQWVRSDNGGSVGTTFKSQPWRICTGCAIKKPLRLAGKLLENPFAAVGYLCPCK